LAVVVAVLGLLSIALAITCVVLAQRLKKATSFKKLKEEEMHPQKD